MLLDLHQTVWIVKFYKIHAFAACRQDKHQLHKTHDFITRGGGSAHVEVVGCTVAEERARCQRAYGGVEFYIFSYLSTNVLLGTQIMPQSSQPYPPLVYTRVWAQNVCEPHAYRVCRDAKKECSMDSIGLIIFKNFITYMLSRPAKRDKDHLLPTPNFNMGGDAWARKHVIARAVAGKRTSWSRQQWVIKL